MQAENTGNRQVLIAGIGFIILQLMLNYLGLSGRSLVKSFCWFLKNRYKLSLYLCIISVIISRRLFGQLADNHPSALLYNFLLISFAIVFAWQPSKARKEKIQALPFIFSNYAHQRPPLI